MHFMITLVSIVLAFVGLLLAVPLVTIPAFIIFVLSLLYGQWVLTPSEPKDDMSKLQSEYTKLDDELDSNILT